MVFIGDLRARLHSAINLSDWVMKESEQFQTWDGFPEFSKVCWHGWVNQISWYPPYRVNIRKNMFPQSCQYWWGCRMSQRKLKNWPNRPVRPVITFPVRHSASLPGTFERILWGLGNGLHAAFCYNLLSTLDSVGVKVVILRRENFLEIFWEQSLAVFQRISANMDFFIFILPLNNSIC